MPRRNSSYDEVLANKFNNPDYAQSYLTSVMELEGLSIEEALKETIKAMGLKSFSDKADLSTQKVSDFVSGRKKWSMEKIFKHIKQVFKLRVKFLLEAA